MPNPDYIIAPYDRARCPVCRGSFNLTKTGVLRAHGDGLHARCAGAGKPPAAAAPAPEVPAALEPQLPIEERRRRLEADIADAKKTLQRAQAHFDSLCNELSALRREERGA